MQEVNRKELEAMPWDKMFYTAAGTQELCHGTGYEVQDTEGEWWTEYEGADGCLYYGR